MRAPIFHCIMYDRKFRVAKIFWGHESWSQDTESKWHGKTDSSRGESLVSGITSRRGRKKCTTSSFSGVVFFFCLRFRMLRHVERVNRCQPCHTCRIIPIIPTVSGDFRRVLSPDFGELENYFHLKLWRLLVQLTFTPST